MICSQLGSSTSLQTTNSILFLEDVDEMYYHVDRMMVAIQRAGLLEGIAGVIVGGLTKMRDNTKEFGFPTDNPWGKNAEETLLSFFEPLRVPVSFGFPAGHQSDNRAFYTGIKARLEVEQNVSKLIYEI